MSQAIAKIVEGDLCVGCGACATMFVVPAAEMSLTPDGFLRPLQTRALTADEARVFTRVCPGGHLAHQHRDASFHALWGPVQFAGTGYATDQEVRFRGSSGGGLSALAIHLLESGAVQGVLHIAPGATAAFDNVAQISTTRADVLRAAGSRYAPAAPLAKVHECLALPGLFAFIGKPCDVAALRALGKERPEVAAKFPVLLSFMCAGTPGIKGTEAVVRQLGFEPGEVVRFRYRGNGWPGMARAETADGRHAEMDYDRSWGQVLNRHLQFRCKICPDGTGEFADVSCADAWHADEKGYPLFTETDRRSLILGRTGVGRQLVADARQAGVLASEPVSLDVVERMQPYQAARKRALLSRLIGLRLAFRSVPAFRNFDLWKVARTMPFKTQLRNAVGMWLRAVGGK